MEEKVPFWKRKTLAEMTPEEWESLCDGCAQCCLYKLQDEDTGELFFTSVVCRLLDIKTCRCTSYADRSSLNPECVWLTPELAMELGWLPATCAYRRLAQGLDLPSWHPLVCGNRQAIHEYGISVRDRAIPENEVDMNNLEDYINDA